MDKAFDALMCLMFSLVLGLTWGGLVYWYAPVLGVSVGITMFSLCMLILVNMLRQYDETASEQNRRFNDA